MSSIYLPAPVEGASFVVFDLFGSTESWSVTRSETDGSLTFAPDRSDRPTWTASVEGGSSTGSANASGNDASEVMLGFVIFLTCFGITAILSF